MQIILGWLIMSSCQKCKVLHSFFFFLHTLLLILPACVSHSEKCRVNVSHSSWTPCPQRSVGICSGDTRLSVQVSGIWKSHPPCSQIIIDTYVCARACMRAYMCETVHCPLESATMLRVFPALWWGNAHGAWAPCLFGHMSFLSLWLTPTATETV